METYSHLLVQLADGWTTIFDEEVRVHGGDNRVLVVIAAEGKKHLVYNADEWTYFEATK